jgi:hypothetical protein
MSTNVSEALDSSQQDRYDVLVTRTARYVRSGAFAIEDCTPDVLFDGEAPDETLVETFRADVRDELERLTATVSDRQRETETPETTTDGAKIDWVALWQEAGIDSTDSLSLTQLELAIDISEQTPSTGAAAASIVADARDAGALLKRRYRYKPAQGGDGW